MSNLPVGTVTFLFTDIEGSTQLWENHPEGMRDALAQHDSILKEAIESNHGYVIKTTGDGVHAVFSTAIDAANAALEGQRQFKSPLADLQVKSRMGIHTGEAELREGDYFGQSLNRAARIMAAGHGGQILLSSIAAELVREHLPAGASLLELGEHRLKDLIRPENIFQLTAPDLPGDFPELHSLNLWPNNLPVQVTSFIGRERELLEAGKLLASTRLLTFIGPGGTGKTRLSLQVAAECLSSFPDGVWLVELASVTDAALITQSLASVFGLREQMGMPLHEIILNYLRAKNLLLILDNCEHLIEACAQLADQLLITCQNLKILASSREALGIKGEVVFRVPSLSLPDPAAVTRDALRGYESIQLFVDRARAASPKFDLTDENASFAAQICRRLDGIPLALELAAARLNMFSPERIAARLDDRFRLLTGGSRTAMPRQQTLRAMIDWSYELLSEDERALLRRLSVFSGGWTFEAAEAVFSDLDVLNVLTQLVNKSLVLVDDECAEPRYRLLETIRQYARDKLFEAGEGEQTRYQHLKYFVNLAESARSDLDLGNILQWIPILGSEYDNIHAAFDWALNTNVEDALRLIGSLASFWFRQGHSAQGIQWAQAALERAGPILELEESEAAREHLVLRARAVGALAVMAYSQGDMLMASQAADDCAVLARRLGDQRMLAIALSFAGSARFFTGDPVGARTRVEEAIDLALHLEEKMALGMAYGLMAQVKMFIEHDNPAAEAYEEKAVSLADRDENNWLSEMVIFGAGRGAIFRGDYETARERFMKCLPIFEKLGDLHRVTMIHSEMAHMDRYEGRLEPAESGYRKTILVWQKLGHRAAIAHQLECFAFIARVHGKTERAARLLGAAESLREKINIQMSPPEHDEYEQEVAQLRGSMPEADFSKAWKQGSALTMEDAIEFALGA